jgi:molybdenum cofactor cytidylyltransferase
LPPLFLLGESSSSYFPPLFRSASSCLCGYLPFVEDIAAIVLAAGRSQRMGAFKPLLPFGPTTVIKACIGFLRAGGIQTIIVVVGQDSHADKLIEHLRDYQVVFATNPDPASEMAVSIACGLRAIPESAKAVVITPADHPAVPAAVVQVLIDEWKKGARLVMPTNNGRGGHPVLIDLEFRYELQDLDSSRGLKALFDSRQEEVSRVAVNSDRIARDMDTWDDYTALHMDVFGNAP